MGNMRLTKKFTDAELYERQLPERIEGGVFHVFSEGSFGWKRRLLGCSYGGLLDQEYLLVLSEQYPRFPDVDDGEQNKIAEVIASFRALQLVPEGQSAVMLHTDFKDTVRLINEGVRHPCVFPGVMQDYAAAIVEETEKHESVRAIYASDSPDYPAGTIRQCMRFMHNAAAFASGSLRVKPMNSDEELVPEIRGSSDGALDIIDFSDDPELNSGPFLYPG